MYQYLVVLFEAKKISFYFTKIMKIYLLFALLLCFIHVSLTKEVVCNTDKGFICYDNTRFYQCVYDGKEKPGLITGELQDCPQGLMCSNDADFECSD